MVARLGSWVAGGLGDGYARRGWGFGQGGGVACGGLELGTVPDLVFPAGDFVFGQI